MKPIHWMFGLSLLLAASCDADGEQAQAQGCEPDVVEMEWSVVPGLFVCDAIVETCALECDEDDYYELDCSVPEFDSCAAQVMTAREVSELHPGLLARVSRLVIERDVVSCDEFLLGVSAFREG